MIDIATIAAGHGIGAEELTRWVTGRGWDFSALDEANAEHVKFAMGVVTGYAQDIATYRAKAEAQRSTAKAAFTAKWETPTKAAKAHPERACRKCSGVGRIITYSHVNDGFCFKCEGTGVR